MKVKLYRLGNWCQEQAENIFFTLALAAIGLGCWWITPAAGLIVPGSIILALQVSVRLLDRR
jgi:hypothetical protein